MAATKVLISISGGVVTGVFSNDPDLKVEINDYDNARESEEDFDAKEKEMEAEEAALNIVY